MDYSQYTTTNNYLDSVEAEKILNSFLLDNTQKRIN